MSNRRRSGMKNLYRQGFLCSPAWFARRERWFAAHAVQGKVQCSACGREGTKRTLELHHLDYRGVSIVRGEWQAGEDDADLIALHPYCHDLLHRLVDRDVVLATHRTRRQASVQALASLRAKIRGRDRDRSRG